MLGASGRRARVRRVGSGTRSPPSSARAFLARLASVARLFLRGRSGVPPGPADDPHLPAVPAAAEEALAAVGFEPRHGDPWRHLEPLQHLACLGIDAPQIALLAFPGAVPELAVDPG